MQVKDINPLEDLCNKVQLILLVNDEKPDQIEKKLSELQKRGYCAFLRTTNFGAEIVISEKI